MAVIFTKHVLKNKLYEYTYIMIKVYRAKDLIKYSITIIIPLIIIMMATKVIAKGSEDKAKYNQEAKMVFSHFDDSIEILKSSKTDEDEEENDYIKEWGKIILDNEFNILNAKQKNENNNVTETKTAEEPPKEIPKEEKVEQAKTDVKTEIVDSGVSPKVTQQYNGVEINNSSRKEITESDMNPEGLNINKQKILIFHTHTCESYTPTDKFSYVANGNYRTTDLAYSVARVGDELETQLKSYGKEAIHDKTYHDYPSYNGSYARSLQTAQKILQENPDIDISIDLHRDAIGDETYAPKVKIGDEYASQLMFVIGTDEAEGVHSNWNQNLKFAIQIQAKANELYPGLFKPIIIRNSDYNQFMSKGACILEVGATGNTLEESMNSMKYLAKVIDK